jgi:hydroxymethylpyrimidine/phosphomethylpyrimidine kinase
MSTYKYPVVLGIAGSDSGGGAGIQADIKTISALGCFATTAVTAVTVQNTLGVSYIHSVPPEIVTAQIKAVMDDIKPLAIKIGMIHTAALALAIASALKEYAGTPVVLDPVMVASSGHHLIEHDAINILKKELFPLSLLVTPNLDEAALLAGMSISNLEDMQMAAAHIIKTGCNAVLVKGGHLEGTDLYDVFLDKTGYRHIFRSEAIDTQNTHGTGCSLSSAIASFIALGNDLVTSISKSKTYVHHAIEYGKDVKTGNGHGPLNHFFDPQQLVKHKLG